MKPQLLTLSLLFLCVALPTQAKAGLTDPPGIKETSPTPFREGVLNGQIGFHLTPSGLLGTFRGLRFGGQVRVGRLIIGGDVLLGNTGSANLLINNEDLFDYDATGFYPEVKYIIAEEGEQELLYISAVVPIRQREMTISTGTYTDFIENVRYDVSGAGQRHEKTSVGIKLGAIKSLGNRLYWEYYAGFGLGRRTTKYSSVASRTLADEQPAEGMSFSGDLLSERQCFQADLLLGLRVGIRL